MDKIRLGYACINEDLGAAKPRVFCSRTVTMETLRGMGVAEGAKYCRALALQNIADFLTILRWNESRGIRLFRMTSCLIPHQGNHLLPPEFGRNSYFRGDIEFAHTALREVGAFARAHGHRLTAHVQPFLQLGTPNQDILKRTMFDLEIHAQIFRVLKTENPVIIMHGGGFYQTTDTREEAKKDTLTRWVTNWKRLPVDLRRWITLENDERIYGVSDLLPICERYGIPFCMDVFHNAISADRVEITRALLARTAKTWSAGSRPKFHVSDQDKKLKFGAHADMVKSIPDYLMGLRNVDIMIEAKRKEKAVMSLYKKQFVRMKGPLVRWSPK